MPNTNTPQIETERLLLRRFAQDDGNALLEILRDPHVNTFLPWLPLRGLDEAEAFLQEHFLRHYDKPIAFRYAVCLKEEDLPIGYVWLADDESNDFGYGLKKEFWHKGYATEASKAVIEAIQRAGYEYITATHDVNNPRSGEVMKKLGMVYQYSYREQWQPKDFAVTFRMYQLNFDRDNCKVYMEYWNKYPVHFVEPMPLQPFADI